MTPNPPRHAESHFVPVSFPVSANAHLWRQPSGLKARLLSEVSAVALEMGRRRFAIWTPSI